MSKASIVFKKVAYTPCSDWLSMEHGLIISAVFGRIWRFACVTGVCQAKINTLSESLGISYITVIRAIKVLEKLEFIIDHTPMLRNRPHTYTINSRKVLTEYFKWKKENPQVLQRYLDVDENINQEPHVEQNKEDFVTPEDVRGLGDKIFSP